MPKDDMETECMNELFNNGNDNDLPYYNHWRPVAICHPDGEKIRDLTKKEQLEWVLKQKERER